MCPTAAARLKTAQLGAAIELTGLGLCKAHAGSAPVQASIVRRPKVPPSLPRISQSQRAVSHPEAQVGYLCYDCPAAMGGDSTFPVLQRWVQGKRVPAALCIKAHLQLRNRVQGCIRGTIGEATLLQQVWGWQRGVLLKSVAVLQMAQEGSSPNRRRRRHLRLDVVTHLEYDIMQCLVKDRPQVSNCQQRNEALCS